MAWTLQAPLRLVGAARIVGRRARHRCCTRQLWASPVAARGFLRCVGQLITPR